MWDGKTQNVDTEAESMTNFLNLVLAVATASLRARGALLMENLLLRHQLAVLARSKPHPPFRLFDRLLWLVARRLTAT